MALLDQMLDRFVRVGTLRLIDPDGTSRTYGGQAPGPSLTLRFKDAAVKRRLFLNPEMTAGEAYTDGTLAVEDGSIRDLLMLFASPCRRRCAPRSSGCASSGLATRSPARGATSRTTTTCRTGCTNCSSTRR
jgi:hypothetical protein